MNKIIKISNMKKIDERHADMAVILSEKHPQWSFWEGKKHNPVENYLWYYYNLEKHPDTYTEYHREKLGITDKNEALDLIARWNQTIKDDNIEVVSFFKTISLWPKKFGLIEDSKSDKIIVMANHSILPKNRWTVAAGSGGYGWQYLSRKTFPSRDELKYKFCLTNGEGRKFIEKWDEIY